MVNVAIWRDYSDEDRGTYFTAGLCQAHGGRTGKVHRSHPSRRPGTIRHLKVIILSCN